MLEEYYPMHQQSSPTRDEHYLASNIMRADLMGELDRERQDALDTLDKAPFSRSHILVTVVAGVGFFADSYDIFAITVVTQILGYVYGLSSHQKLGITIATPAGNLLGQLLFGWLADQVGRKRMYGFELMIMIVATLGQALAGNAEAENIIGVIIFYRFIMGIGIGGDYPLSSVISAEFSTSRHRGRLMTAVFANQGWGQFVAALLAFITVEAYGKDMSTKGLDQMWRIVLGFGCVPAACALYFRLTLPETPRFTMDIVGNVRRPPKIQVHTVDPEAVKQYFEKPQSGTRSFVSYFSDTRNLRQLFCVSYSWFVLDFAFYGLTLNSPTVLQAAGYGIVNNDVFQSIEHISLGSLILSIAGYIPGYWAAFLVIDRPSWGRKRLQLVGFVMLTIILAIMGGIVSLETSDDQLPGPASKGFMFLFCLANFFQNFGPNTTTFIMSAEAFPTRYRSTGAGIASASGKLGAVISQVIFWRITEYTPNEVLSQKTWYLLVILAGFMLTGVASTLLIDETSQLSLEEIAHAEGNAF